MPLPGLGRAAGGTPGGACTAGACGRRRPLALEAVRQFTPSWFSASMSTGIVALVIGTFPYDAPAKKEIVSGRR